MVLNRYIRKALNYFALYHVLALTLGVKIKRIKMPLVSQYKLSFR